MDSANYIIGKFGGQSALANRLGKGRSTVQHWAKTGIIPPKYHAPILQLARENGIEVRPKDFVEPPGVTQLESIPKPPDALYSGVLADLDMDNHGINCYVLNDGRRVISRTGAVGAITGQWGDGNLENYIGIKALASYLPPDLPDAMVEFTLDGVVNRTVKGITHDTFLSILRAYVRANAAGELTTDRQRQIAFRASVFLAGVADIGLIALIDEVTGYQYARADDALQLKLRLYIENEMRKWESTFPEELWREFGRLTNWQGSIHRRPKYWGKLVMELVYEYLDSDVADWLRDNAPKPRHGQNYHQWLSGQYGLKRLVEHIWMLIGIASTCHSLYELRMRMAERFGRQAVQMTLFVYPPYRILPQR